jgi:hypothetical protein
VRVCVSARACLRAGVGHMHIEMHKHIDTRAKMDEETLVELSAGSAIQIRSEANQHIYRPRL